MARHPMSWNALGGACLLACLDLIAPIDASSAPVVPAGFVVENAFPGVTFSLPTGVAFFPDGRALVAEKGGNVFVVDGGVKYPLKNLQLEVHSAVTSDDRGLLDVAVDPSFNTNRYVYLLYTVDPDTNGVDNPGDFCFGRLTRYQMTSTTSNAWYDTTRAILFGRTWPEGPTSISVTHTIGSLRWGADGSLLVSAGEGAEFQSTDAGGNQPDAFGVGKTDLDEDVGAFRAQYLQSLAGKILRIDPATGLGYPSNPFYDGDPASKQSRVYAYGLRNPFRFCVRPGTGSANPADGNPGVLYIGDVGWSTWEELSVATQAGRNFGWPCYEGTHTAAEYPTATPAHSDCGTIGTAENPSLHTPPISDWHHSNPSLSSPAGIIGNAASGSAFYTGTSYPAQYQGLYFYADYGQSWIRMVQVDANNNPISFMPFGTSMDMPVDIVPNPITGDLYYVSISSGQVRRIRFVSGVGVEPQGVSFQLGAPAPNPTHGRTSLTLQLPRAARVSLAVHDVQGRLVWSSPERDCPAGRWPLEWDSKGVRSGLYLMRVAVDGQVLLRRVAVLR